MGFDKLEEMEEPKKKGGFAIVEEMPEEDIPVYEPGLIERGINAITPEKSDLEKQAIAAGMGPRRFNPAFFKANLGEKFAGVKTTVSESIDPAKIAGQLATGAGGFALGTAGAVGSLVTDAFKSIDRRKFDRDTPVMTRAIAAENFKGAFEGINKAVSDGVDKITGNALHSKRADRGAEIVSGILEEILHPIHTRAEQIKEEGYPLAGEIFKLGGEIVALGKMHERVTKPRQAGNIFDSKKAKQQVKGTVVDPKVIADKVIEFKAKVKEAGKSKEIDTKPLDKITLEGIKADPDGVALALENVMVKFADDVKAQEAKTIEQTQRNLFPEQLETEIPIGDLFKQQKVEITPDSFGEKFVKASGERRTKEGLKRRAAKKATLQDKVFEKVIKNASKLRPKKPATDAKAIIAKAEKKVKSEKLKAQAAERKAARIEREEARAVQRERAKVQKEKVTQVKRSEQFETKKKNAEIIKKLQDDNPTVKSLLKVDTKSPTGELDLTPLRKYRTATYAHRPRTNKAFDSNLRDLRNIEALIEKYETKPEITASNYKVADSVKRGIFTAEEGAVVSDIISKFKEQPKVDVTEKIPGSNSRINIRTGKIQLGQTRAIWHELGHYAFEHILKGKDRLAFLDGMREYSSEIKTRPKLQDKLAEVTNATDNYHEYFAEQFAQYINNTKLTQPQFRTMMKKVVDALKKLLTKARKEKLYDENLQPFFDKIINADKPVAKPKKPATVKAARLAMMKAMVEKRKLRKAKAEEDVRAQEELYDDMINESADHIDLFDEFLFSKSGEQMTKERLANRLKAKWFKNDAEIDVARNELAKAKKTTEGYSDRLTEHYNKVLHEATSNGIGFDEVYRRMGVKEYELKKLTEGAERYAEVRIKEFKKIRGEQVNRVWKNKKEGVLNTPVYQRDLLDMRRIGPADLPPARFGRALTLPDVVFDKFGPEVKELWMGRVDNAYDLIAKERSQASVRLKDVKKLVKRKDRETLNNYMFAQQHFGKAYLDGIGKKIPTWDDLSPGAQVAYEYLRGQYESFYDRINMTRRQNGQRPFGKQDNYATMMRDFSAMEEAGIGDVRVEAADFKRYQLERNLTESKFNWDKKRSRLVDAEGNPVAIYETDAFKVLDSYSKAGLNAVYLNPVVSFFDKLLDMKVKVKEGGKTQSVNMMSLQSPTARDWLRSYNNRIALNRPKQLGEGSGDVSLTPLYKYGDAAINHLNQSLTAAYLSASARLAVTQIAALGNTIAIAPLDVMPGIVKAFLPGNKSKIFNKSKRLFSRVAGGDAHLNDLTSAVFDTKGKWATYKTATRRLSEKGLILTHAMDGLVARASWEAFYAQAKRRGLNSHESMRYADSTVTKTQSSGQLSQRAPIQTTAGGKAITLFQTFTISQYNLLRYDIGAGLIGKGGKGKGGKFNFTKGERDYISGVEKQTGKKVNSEKVIQELRDARYLAEAMAKSVGVKDVRAITKLEAVNMTLMFVTGKALIDSMYEDGLGVQSPNPTPVSDMTDSYVKDEDAAKAILAFGKGLAGFVPILSSTTHGGGFGGAAYTAVADVMGAKSGDRFANALANLLLIPGVGTIKTALKADEIDEQHPLYYLIRRKKETKKGRPRSRGRL